jgi:hypothetical protein
VSWLWEGFWLDVMVAKMVGRERGKGEGRTGGGQGKEAKRQIGMRKPSRLARPIILQTTLTPPRSTRELSEEGYSGCEVRVTHAKTEIIIRATHTQDVLGEKGRRIRELTALIAKRFKFPENSLELYAEKVKNRGLSAVAQAESLRYKLLGGLAIRR